MDADNLYIQRVANAAAIRGIMDDARWEHVIAVVTRLLDAAKARESHARKNPTLDGMIQATHHTGQVVALENLLRTFISLYDGAGRVLTDAREKLPYAPKSPGEHRKQTAPEGGEPQGGSNVRAGEEQGAGRHGERATTQKARGKIRKPRRTRKGVSRSRKDGA